MRALFNTDLFKLSIVLFDSSLLCIVINPNPLLCSLDIGKKTEWTVPAYSKCYLSCSSFVFKLRSETNKFTKLPVVEILTN